MPNAGKTNKSNGRGTVIFNELTHLHGPLALALAPNGHLLTSNGDAPTVNPDPNQPSEMVEFTKTGQFIGQLSSDRNIGGAFGIAITPASDDAVRFAAVNDDDNTIIVLTLNFGGFHAGQ